MKEIKRFITITLACCAISTTQAQLAEPYYKLPDPLLMNDGKTKVESLSDWNTRRQEIGEMIQELGIGRKPEVSPEAVKASMKGDTLIVDVTVNGETPTAVDISDEDMELLRETERRGYIQIRNKTKVKR